jgi:hypothetical protein
MEEHSLKLSENRALWKIFGFKICEVQRHEGNCVIWKFTVWTLTKYILGDQINQHAMNGVCVTHWVKERCTEEFGWGTWGKEETLKVYAYRG